jgi:nucleotide-binding universal stress UspA family protein
MYSTIVVGVDGHSGGRDAIALARTLGGSATELVLVHVWKGVDGVMAAAAGAQPPVRSGEKLLEQARRELGRPCRTVTHQAASVAGGLHRQAELLGADLLVVGSSRRQGAGRVLLGDDALAALHAAPCALAVAPRGLAGDPRPLRRVGVAYRPGPEGDAAVAAARAIAREQRAELHATIVLPILPSAWEGPPFAYVDVVEDITGEHERSAREQLAGLGPDVVGHVARGVAIEELVRASQDVDLLVVGSRAHGPLRRLLLGSTADGVARDAACPVLVVTRGAREAACEPAVAPPAGAGA